jgi:DNA-binding transcriptional LysR family regulator
METGSFSAAGRTLGVGQPAVSKSVAQLEARLGVRLLMRSTRGLAPTEAGMNFYERAKRALEEADEAEAAARGAGAGPRGHLRASARAFATFVERELSESSGGHAVRPRRRRRRRRRR